MITIFIEIRLMKVKVLAYYFIERMIKMEFNSKQRRKIITVWLSDEERILV